MKSALAAIQILKKAGTALHVKDLTSQMLAEGLWQSNGKTPIVTVGSRLYADIRKNGNRSSFKKVAPQTFTLNDPVVNKNASVRSTPKIKKTLKLPFVTTDTSFTDCAQKVLDNFAGKKPMHYKEITRMAREKGWLATDEKISGIIMRTQITNEIKRQRKCGERPRFVRQGQDSVGLSQWAGNEAARQIEQHNQQVRKALHEQLLLIKPDVFAVLIVKLLAEMGFVMVETNKLSTDGNIDIRGVWVVNEVIRIRMFVQIRKRKSSIPVSMVRQMRGNPGMREHGLIITSGDFSTGAIKEVEQPDKAPVTLINGEQLVKLLMEYGIGVHRTTMNQFDIDEQVLVI